MIENNYRTVYIALSISTRAVRSCIDRQSVSSTPTGRNGTMMEILKSGWTSSTWEKELECQACGAFLKITHDDLYIKEADAFDEMGCEQVSADCLSCTKRVKIADLKDRRHESTLPRR